MTKPNVLGKQDISIALESGNTRPIRADRVTVHFAVHRPLYGARRAWTVTHLPTGFTATMCETFSTKARAVTYAQWLERLRAIQWDSSEVASYKGQPASVKRRMDHKLRQLHAGDRDA